MSNDTEKQKKFDELTQLIFKCDNEIKELFIQYGSNKDFGYDYLYAIGIAKKSCAITFGFIDMIKNKNTLCAMSLIRIHLDTMLRLYAGFFCNEQSTFSEKVLAGAVINQMSSDDGKKMSDNYLAKRVSRQNPWVINVYRKTSGYIHFSSEHIMSSLNHQEKNHFQMCIGPYEPHRKNTDYIELLECFFHITAMIKIALEDWLGLLKR